LKYEGRHFVKILGVDGRIILNGSYRNGISLVQHAVSVACGLWPAIKFIVQPDT